jgi:opacity protein-like surface antigen
MRSKLLTAAGLLSSAAAFTAPAWAADILPEWQPPAVQPVRPVPPNGPYVADWTGFYFGFDIGSAWGRTSFDPATTAVTPPPGTSANGDILGGHAGYNWQYGSLVGGVEVDYTGAGLTNTSPFIPGTLVSKESTLDELGSARGRFGYAVLPNVVTYGTAGVGWGRSRLTVTDPAAGFSETAFINEFGWVAGGGVEYRLFEHLQLRLEYLHYDFGESTADLSTRSVSQRDRVDLVRGGISYKF